MLTIRQHDMRYIADYFDIVIHTSFNTSKAEFDILRTSQCGNGYNN